MTQNTGHKTNSLAENPKVSKTLKKKNSNTRNQTHCYNNEEIKIKRGKTC